MTYAVFALLVAVPWVGHVYILTAILNNLYGRRLPKAFLKPYRLFTGVAILCFPLPFNSAWRLQGDPVSLDPVEGRGHAVLAYLTVCCIVGGIVVPAVTAYRLLKPKAAAVVAERTDTVDLWPLHGPALIGDGKMSFAPRLPLNCCFQVDFTDLTLSVPSLPAAWDGLTVLLLSDLHFHGTPSRLYFEQVVKRLAAGPPPDVVVLAGDYVDTDTHREWLAPVLGPLKWAECGLAVLGNHDAHHAPDTLRADLAGLGYRVLGNGWQTLTIRGVEAVAVGHEGPWFAPPPDLSAAPVGPFRLCVSHSPDSFDWGRANKVGLMLAGHVHGGQVRLPVVGSIFVPSVYGRRFDQGVFEAGGTVLVVSRGLSGKEPLRFRCHPQAVRLTLRPRG